jgi:hypothetical protein
MFEYNFNRAVEVANEKNKRRSKWTS